MLSLINQRKGKMQKGKPLNTVKKRVETMDERLSRLTHLYDDGPKPVHLDDKSIVTMEDWSKMKPVIKKTPVIKTTPNNIGEYFSNKETKPKKRISMWQLMLSDAKNPKTKEDRIQAKEIKDTLLDKYRDKNSRKLLDDEELKLIGKHKSQIKYPEIPKIDINFNTFESVSKEPSLNDVMNSPNKVTPGFKPGLSEDLISLQSDVQKNVDYVLGKTTERSESTNKEEMLTPTNKEETN